MRNRENLEFPWSLEDTIENIESIRNMLVKRVRGINLDGKAECDVREINLDFGRAIKALKEESTNEWIPVSERLPEDGIYLCTLDGELCGIDEPFTGMCGIENGMWDEPDCVIAWMPLPEPYIPDIKPDLPEPAAEHYMNRFTEVR